MSDRRESTARSLQPPPPGAASTKAPASADVAEVLHPARRMKPPSATFASPPRADPRLPALPAPARGFRHPLRAGGGRPRSPLPRRLPGGHRRRAESCELTATTPASRTWPTDRGSSSRPPARSRLRCRGCAPELHGPACCSTSGGSNQPASCRTSAAHTAPEPASLSRPGTLRAGAGSVLARLSPVNDAQLGFEGSDR